MPPSVIDEWDTVPPDARRRGGGGRGSAGPAEHRARLLRQPAPERQRGPRAAGEVGARAAVAGSPGMALLRWGGGGVGFR